MLYFYLNTILKLNLKPEKNYIKLGSVYYIVIFEFLVTLL